jgi:hypothetical protein
VSTEKDLAVCGFLLLAAGFIFGQTVCHDFVNYDDEKEVRVQERAGCARPQRRGDRPFSQHPDGLERL